MRSLLLRLLRPRSAEVRALAFRETDPAHYREFEPITLGPAGNLALLVAIGLCAVVVSPVRLLFRLIVQR